MLSLPAKIKILLILAKTFEKQKLNFSRSALVRLETKVSLKYFVDGCALNFIHNEVIYCICIFWETIYTSSLTLLCIML